MKPWLGWAIMFTLVVTVFVGALMLWLLLIRFETYEPIVYHNPRTVLTDPVAAETFIDVRVEWCNEDAGALISSSSAFQAVGQEGVLVPRGVLVVELEEGCHVETVRVNLPETVTPGVWRLGGVDTAIGPDGSTQRIAWFTGTFRVIAGPRGQ